MALVSVQGRAQEDGFEKSFRVSVQKVFKATEEAKAGLATGYVWTPAYDGICGANLKEGKRYLIAGGMRDSKPWFIVCSFSREWNTFTPEQEEGFRGQYQRGCNCTVASIPRNEDTRPRCEWRNDLRYSGKDCESMYATCVPNPSQEEQGCRWLGGQHYRDCTNAIGQVSRKKMGIRRWRPFSRDGTQSVR